MATRRPFPILPEIDVEPDAPRPRVTLPPLPGERGPSPSLPPPIPSRDARPARPVGPVRRRRERSSLPTALLMGVPSLIPAGLALLLSRTGAWFGDAFGGAASLVIVGAVVAGCWFAWQTSSALWRYAWLVALGVTTGLLPLLTLQATLARLPHAGSLGESVAPVLLATLGAALVLVLIAGVVAVGTRGEPHGAGPLFLPAPLLVPALLSVPALPAELPVLRTFAAVSALAGIAIVGAWLLPEGLRPLIGPLALGVEFVLLWIMDRGPMVDPTSGRIVPVLYGTLVALTVVLVVVVPLLAVWVRRLVAEVSDEGDGRGLAAPTPGGRGGSRSSI